MGLISYFYMWRSNFASTYCGKCCLFSSMGSWLLSQISDGCNHVYSCIGRLLHSTDLQAVVCSHHADLPIVLQYRLVSGMVVHLVSAEDCFSCQFFEFPMEFWIDCLIYVKTVIGNLI